MTCPACGGKPAFQPIIFPPEPAPPATVLEELAQEDYELRRFAAYWDQSRRIAGAKDGEAVELQRFRLP